MDRLRFIKQLTGKYAKFALTTLETSILQKDIDITESNFIKIRKIILDVFSDFKREIESLDSSKEG